MIFKNGLDLDKALCAYIDNSQSLYIFSAYIKLETLKSLIANHSNVKAVFVRWEPKDFISGSSDIEVYPYLKEKGITLYRNSRLHLKAYLDDYNKCFLTSANISSRALNIPEFKKYNYEIATIVENLDINDKLYFHIIESDSMLITDSIYNQLVEQIPEKKNMFPDETEFEFIVTPSDKDFLISSLPLTVSINRLTQLYNDNSLASDIEINCLLHDLALYKIPFGLTTDIFIERLKVAFFNHKFIIAFLDNLNINNEIYFGRAKAWIHENCADVPLPRRWEITSNIQILYKWFVELGDGKYKVDVPGAHSERLSITSD